MSDSLLKSPASKNIFRSQEVNLLIAIFLAIVAITFLDSNHNYWHKAGENTVQIIRQATLLGMFSLGAAIVIIAGGIDLSSGSVIAFSGTICAAVMLLIAPEAMQSGGQIPLDGWVIFCGIAAAILAGFLIGSLHAWLITVVGLPPFVATLATLVGLRSLARALCRSATEAISGGQGTQIDVNDLGFRYLSTSVWIPALVFIVLALLCWLLLSRTVVGRHIYALGGNEEAARLSGIQTDKLQWLAYCLSAILSSVAGVFYIGEQAVAAPQSLGLGYELNGIAAAVVGGCSLAGGIGTIHGTVLGALFLRIVMDGVAKIVKTGADLYEGLIVGIVVVFAVAFSQSGETRRGSRFFAGSLGIVTIVNLALLAAAMAALVGPKLWQTSHLDQKHLAVLASGLTVCFLFLIRSSISRKRRRFFGTTIVVLFGVAAFQLDAWLPVLRYQWAEQAVVELGGTVETLADENKVAKLSNLDIDDDKLKKLAAKLKYLTNLTEIHLDGTKVTGQGLESLEQVKSLKRIKVTNTPFAKSGVRLPRSINDLELID